jgi:hypothetical protein
MREIITVTVAAIVSCYIGFLLGSSMTRLNLEKAFMLGVLSQPTNTVEIDSRYVIKYVPGQNATIHKIILE